MTPETDSYWAAAESASSAPGPFAWSVLVVLLALSALGGWAVSGALQRQWRQGDQVSPLISSWGEPDLAAPSRSADALAEVAELEALWRQSPRRGRASSD
jgi:hypothetical protein